MVFTQVLIGSLVFPFNCRFKSLRFTLNGYYLIIFWAHWMLNVRSIYFLVIIYDPLKGESRRVVFHCRRPLMLSKYHFSKDNY